MNKIYEFAKNHRVASTALVGGIALGTVIYGGIELNRQDNEILV